MLFGYFSHTYIHQFFLTSFNLKYVLNNCIVSFKYCCGHRFDAKFLLQRSREELNECQQNTCCVAMRPWRPTTTRTIQCSSSTTPSNTPSVPRPRCLYSTVAPPEAAAVDPGEHFRTDTNVTPIEAVATTDEQPLPNHVSLTPVSILGHESDIIHRRRHTSLRTFFRC